MSQDRNIAMWPSRIGNAEGQRLEFRGSDKCVLSIPTDKPPIVEEWLVGVVYALGTVVRQQNKGMRETREITCGEHRQ